MEKKFPTTQIIKLSSNIDQLSLLEKGLIKDIRTKGIVSRKEQSNVIVNIRIIKVFSPKNFTGTFKTHLKTQTISKSDAIVLETIYDFFNAFCNEKRWLIVGYIEGKKEHPILIVYYEIIDIAVYSIKFSTNEIENFFPAGIPSNPRNN